MDRYLHIPGKSGEYLMQASTETYGLNFIGKAAAKQQAITPPTTTVIPDEIQNNGAGKYSKNLFFTGDNLEVLKHLQTSYQSKVDVIYIDPPYNTGSGSFTYHDNYNNHSTWLAFMTPRLILARNLLKDSGVIFVSINDAEEADLYLLLSEIFGEQNFVARFVWTKTDTPPALSKKKRSSTEYILAFEKKLNNAKRYFGSIKKNADSPLIRRHNALKTLILPPGSAQFKFLENGTLKAGQYDQITLFKDIVVQNSTNTNEIQMRGSMGWSQEKLDCELKKGAVIIFKTKDLNPRYIKAPSNDYKAPNTNLNREDTGVDTNIHGSNYLVNLGFKRGAFTYPKPISLIKYLINMVTYQQQDALVMDFFAGSSTTADAVLHLNAEDNGQRHFIMIQLPEKTYSLDKNSQEIPTKGGHVAYDMGFKTIADLSRERIQRAAERLKKDNALTLSSDFDGSFQHFYVK